MKLQANKQTFLKCVQSVQNAVSTKTTLPILSNILLESTDTGMKMIGTDLDLGIACEVSAEVLSPGSTTIPAKKLSDIVKELPDSTITLEVKKNNVITIDCEKTFYKMMGLPKDEFPKFPEFVDKEMIVLSQSLLKNMLMLTAFAISHEETRFVLNGVLFNLQKGFLNIVATDGRRLALIERQVDKSQSSQKTMIIPTKTVHELIRSLSSDQGDVKIVFGDRQVLFEIGNIVIISRLIEGEFPNYKQVIPQNTNIQIDVNREEFLLATRRVSLFTNEESQAVKVDLLKDKMVISKNTPQLGEAREEVALEYDGKQISIGFNPQYLIDVLKNVDEDTISFELIAPDKPGIIRTKQKNYTYVILPMQLV